MEGPIEPNMGPSLADVLFCTFESTNAGFSSFPVRKLLPESWQRAVTLNDSINPKSGYVTNTSVAVCNPFIVLASSSSG
jgi:hypothetical protein